MVNLRVGVHKRELEFLRVKGGLEKIVSEKGLDNAYKNGVRVPWGGGGWLRVFGREGVVYSTWEWGENSGGLSNVACDGGGVPGVVHMDNRACGDHWEMWIECLRSMLVFLRNLSTCDGDL